ncbi:MAG TPA: hypothetical protein VND98_06170 [Solirubrobacterales bacterium]|nr:hypothetical protein [Solirubrobacterales bacterium]
MLRTEVHVEDPTEDRGRRIAQFAAVSAEALRALGRFHPSPQRDAPPAKLIDEKLDIVLKNLDKLGTADGVVGRAVTMLSVAAAGAVDVATEARGERVERRDKGDLPPRDAFCHGLFDIARTYAEVMASELISTA